MEEKQSILSTLIASVVGIIIVFMISLTIIRFAPDAVAQRIAACTVHPDNQYISGDCVKGVSNEIHNN